MINLGDKYFEIANNIKGITSIKFYVKAALEYSLSGQKHNSGLSYQLAADVFKNHNLKYQAALNYIKATNQYNNIDNAIVTLTTAINLLNSTKHFKLAANNLELLASLNIKGKRFLEAINAYEKAYKNYVYLNMNKEASKCFRKISTIMIQNEDYERAIVHLQKLDSKETFFDLGILKLYINKTTVCTEFLIKQHEFMLTKEYFLLNDLIIALDQKNKIKFKKLIIDYNDIFPLQKWHFNLLINILRKI
jgi:tetratricopeptide (TPR) repeat protein